MTTSKAIQQNGESVFFAQQTESSRIKANIVANYFPKYCKILFKTHKGNIMYLDLFAGPGIYDDGSVSTPILIGDSCASDSMLKDRVLLMFNDKEYGSILKEKFDSRYPEGTFKMTPHFANKTVGEDSDIENYLCRTIPKGSKHIPTLLFFDPFGYKGVNTNTLAKFMNNFGNEIFLFFNIKRIHAAIENSKFDDLMTELFPSTIDKIRKNRKYTLSVQERLSLIIENLATEFKTIVPKIHHCAFRFQEEDSIATSHYIIHFTKHPRGYDLVKQIYSEFDNVGASLDANGDYTFDVKYLSNDSFLDFGDVNIDNLTTKLLADFKGIEISAYDMFEQHHCSTKYSRKHYCDTLRHMFDQNMIEAQFTDHSNHKASVLISPFCILKFK